MAESNQKPVVEPVKMPKIKIEHKKLATINAFAIALAMFLGYCAIFAAISGFTKKWNFAIPFFGRFMGTNAGVPISLLTALFAVIFAIFGFVSLGKVTDAEATKKSWNLVSKVFFGFVIVYVVDMVAIAVYSLLSIGRGKYFDQGNFWLDSFLSTVICCAGAGVMAYMGKQIAVGKTSLLRIASLIATALAIIGFIIVFIQILVDFYGDKSKGSYDSYREATDSLYDIFNSGR